MRGFGYLIKISKYLSKLLTKVDEGITVTLEGNAVEIKDSDSDNKLHVDDHGRGNIVVVDSNGNEVIPVSSDEFFKSSKSIKDTLSVRDYDFDYITEFDTLDFSNYNTVSGIDNLRDKDESNYAYAEFKDDGTPIYVDIDFTHKFRAKKLVIKYEIVPSTVVDTSKKFKVSVYGENSEQYVREYNIDVNGISSIYVDLNDSITTGLSLRIERPDGAVGIRIYGIYKVDRELLTLQDGWVREDLFDVTMTDGLSTDSLDRFFDGNPHTSAIVHIQADYVNSPDQNITFRVKNGIVHADRVVFVFAFPHVFNGEYTASVRHVNGITKSVSGTITLGKKMLVVEAEPGIPIYEFSIDINLGSGANVDTTFELIGIYYSNNNKVFSVDSSGEVIDPATEGTLSTINSKIDTLAKETTVSDIANNSDPFRMLNNGNSIDYILPYYLPSLDSNYYLYIILKKNDGVKSRYFLRDIKYFVNQDVSIKLVEAKELPSGYSYDTIKAFDTNRDRDDGTVNDDVEFLTLVNSSDIGLAGEDLYYTAVSRYYTTDMSIPVTFELNDRRYYAFVLYNSSGDTIRSLGVDMLIRKDIR